MRSRSTLRYLSGFDGPYSHHTRRRPFSIVKQNWSLHMFGNGLRLLHFGDEIRLLHKQIDMLINAVKFSVSYSC